jgi:hypothetical protein
VRGILVVRCANLCNRLHYDGVISEGVSVFPRLQIARWVVAHHLGVRAIPPLATGYNRPEDLPQFPLGDVQRVKIARVFAGGQLSFTEAEINSMPRRAAAAFCLPARCGVGVPPWATASRKCLAVLIGGWEPSLLQVTSVW